MRNAVPAKCYSWTAVATSMLYQDNSKRQYTGNEKDEKRSKGGKQILLYGNTDP